MSGNTRTILALSRLPRINRARLRQILGRLAPEGHAELAVADALARAREYAPALRTADLDRALAKADELLELCQRLGVTVRPYGWASYPSQLQRLSDPPALLFSIGRFDFDHTPRIGVIGTRAPTPWGLKTARACAAQVARSRGVVVSGLALGIDAAAHAATVEHHGATWAVVAHGLHTVSPSANRVLAQEIVDKGGALISEYAPGEEVQRHHFVDRDRIQAGLSDAVLVIETDIAGGAMHTVRFAREARVPVWVTFPSAKIQTADRERLPEPQQGTWELLRANTAARVATVRSLDRMMRDLTRTTASIIGRE
jgi:DNA processing protein